jgi:hypothetical protein
VSKELLIETFLLVVLATLGIYEGLRLSKATLLFPDAIGPGGYLLFISSMLFICSVLNLLVRVLHGKHEAIGERNRSSIHVGQAGWVLILLTLYAIAVPIVGYTFGTVFFFVFTLRISGVSSWFRSVLIGLIFTIAFKLVFFHVAGIIFP